MKTAVYPGSFDPVTNGHLDIIRRASKIFDKVVVSVFVNKTKSNAFSIEERVAMLEKVTAEFDNVEITSSDKLLVHFMTENNINIIIKGLRMISDFEAEFQMALANREQCPEIETLFMMTSSELSHVSSSLVRELASYGADISPLVPPQCIDAIYNKFKR
ncbi:MAG: pantetheine-phosphate adenylyltransferase [Monoglobales bacterium]